MHMKKIYFLIAMVTATVLASCTKEQEDFFDQSSAVRADATLSADLQVLTSAANGWLMQYFPDSQQSFGGYNIIVRFKADGTAEVTDEFHPDTVFSSLYSVTQSAGVVLVFDSYNPSLHGYSDPSSPLRGVGNNGLGHGLDGEFEFAILKASAEQVVLKGKKTGNQVVLTPMADSNWEAYFAKIDAVATAMNSKKYGIHLADTTLIALPSDRTLALNYTEEGEEKDTYAPFIVTPEGMKFYEPIEIRGQKISGFNYVDGTDIFPATDGNGVTLNIIYPTLAELATENWWMLAYSGMGALGKQYWDVLAQVQEQVLGETLNYAIFGLYGSNFGITFNSSGYAGSLLYSFTIVDDTTLTLQWRGGNTADNGSWYVNNAYYGNYFAGPFGTSASGPRTFTLTADNPNDPTWILMTDVANPDNTIMLYSDIIYYPLTQ